MGHTQHRSISFWAACVPLTLLAILTLPLIAEGPRGTVPRSAAEKYPAHDRVGAAALGATLLTPKEMGKAFTTDLSRCCLVVEAALYPAKDKAIDISLEDFVLRLAGTETAVRPYSARLLAAEIEKEKEHSKEVNSVAEAHVGYESGVDPLTGQRVHGVDYGVGVGASIGQNPSADPGSANRELDRMELELLAKSLPEDTISAPVSGYLYFPIPKGNKKGNHQLEYTLNGQKVLLKLD